MLYLEELPFQPIGSGFQTLVPGSPCQGLTHPGWVEEAKQLPRGQATLTCSFASSCFSAPRCWPWQAAEGPESGTSKSPLCRKMWVCNYCSIIIICFMLPKRSVNDIGVFVPLENVSAAQRGRAKLSWHFWDPSCMFQGRWSLEWETRPATVLRESLAG